VKESSGVNYQTNSKLATVSF